MLTITTREWLEEVRFLDARIEALDELIDRTRSRLYGSKSSGLSGMPGGKGGDWTNLFTRIEGLEEEKTQLKQMLDEAKALFRSLPRSEHRTAMELYYVRGLSEPKIALSMGVDLRTIQRWKAAATEIIEKKRTGV